jgi:maleylpyruvate isomerase
MDVPLADVEGCRLAHRRLCAALEEMADADVVGSSLLPEWTVAHVLTHLARNAEAMVRRIEAARSGKTVNQYQGGPKGRALEIDAGATRPARDIISDVVAWSNRLDSIFASLPNDAWALPVRTVAGDEHPVSLLPFRRWREVEIHHVDLNIGFGPSDWSDELVERALPRLIAGLQSRANGPELMAWMLGRGNAPALKPWG